MTVRPLLIVGVASVALSQFCFAGVAPTGCSSCPGMTWVRTNCRFFFLPVTEPRVVGSLENLPPEIVAQANHYLSKRLGQAFLAKLQFREAHVLDLDSYYKANPSLDRATTRAPAYELAFLVPFDPQGPVEYCATLQLDTRGSPFADIELPDVG